MKISLTLTACCIAIAGAMPFGNSPNSTLSNSTQYTDSEILNFILSLSQFSDAFFQQGLVNFTQAQFAEAGFNADFYTNLTQIASHEHTHVTALTTTLKSLNVTPVAECTYNFNGTSPLVFVQDAGLIESVSVSAYIGLLGGGYLKNPAYLKLFSSVLAVQARHTAYIRAALGNQPFPSPYDTPLDLDQVYTLVQLFIVSCPQQNPLGLKNYPTLSSAFTNYGVIGRQVTFVTYGQDVKVGSDCEPLYAAFLTLTGPLFAPTIRLPNNGGFNVTVPATPQGFAPINGLMEVVLSSSNTTLTDDNTVAGPASIEIHLQ